MNRNLKITTPIFLGRILTAIFALVLWLPAIVWAADNDKEILNQLYQEIIGSSSAAKSMKMDSMHTPDQGSSPDREMVMPSGKNSDLVSERLKKEMEKILKDAQLRHSDAVKFMQDVK
jgi:hypothetical protein